MLQYMASRLSEGGDGGLATRCSTGWRMPTRRRERKRSCWSSCVTARRRGWGMQSMLVVVRMGTTMPYFWVKKEVGVQVKFYFHIS